MSRVITTSPPADYACAVANNLVDASFRREFARRRLPAMAGARQRAFGRAPTDVLKGITPATASKLNELGIRTVGELAFSRADLSKQLGRRSKPVDHIRMKLQACSLATPEQKAAQMAARDLTTEVRRVQSRLTTAKNPLDAVLPSTIQPARGPNGEPAVKAELNPRRTSRAHPPHRVRAALRAALDALGYTGVGLQM